MRENIKKAARFLREAARELEGMRKLSQKHEKRREEPRYAAIFFSLKY